VAAADRDLSDKQAHEPLPAVEGECVGPARGALGESGDSLAEPVVDGKIVALDNEGGAFVGQAGAPLVNLPGAPLHIGEFHETSLPEVGQASTLRLRSVNLATKASKLRFEQLLIIERRPVSGNSTLAEEEDLTSQQRRSHLFEYQNIEIIGSDVAFRASAILTASPDRLLIMTPVAPTENPFATPRLMAGAAHMPPSYISANPKSWMCRPYSRDPNRRLIRSRSWPERRGIKESPRQSPARPTNRPARAHSQREKLLFLTALEHSNSSS
jgi:hypothetical protein